METFVSNHEQVSTFFTGRNEVDNAGLSVLRKHNSAFVMKVLRWSFNDVIHACAQTLNCRLAEQLILQMWNLGMEPSCSTYDGFIRAVVFERGFHDGIELLKAMQQKNLKPYDSTLATIAIGCCKALELDLAEALLDQISKSPHAHAYNAFLEACDTLLKALGAEGMVRELIQYLRVAENQFSRGYSCLGTPTYNTVLHSLVEAKEILLGNGDFDEALNLLDQGIMEGIQSDVLLFNTILQGACEKGRIDIIELIVERMHQKNVQPDPSTCYFVFSAYIDHDYISTAMEALQVLSMRMISEEDGILEEKRTELEESFILAEDLEAESRILKLFRDSQENLAVSLLYLRWCATLGFEISWLPNRSLWAKRLSSNYSSREGVAVR
ncbi:hypothetical protein HYC85_008326 [Camellia sinensis]|uniref:Pentacotripeptide-repeat region of PRORP domain-containing protein n=1 Tax=Camellia sinensis TaxID=4442 RepID=A0A7J7HRG7_CAMSI|nr:hypothetical protein HYC85_008326 [Camellia sinensis]